MPRMVECEINRASPWERVSIEEVLSLRGRNEGPDGRLRCPECHGRVRAHEAGGAAAAHFEHLVKFEGCPLGSCFSGTRGRHPDAVEHDLYLEHGRCETSKVFVFWDNTNIIHEAQMLAGEKDGNSCAENLVRIQFDNLLRLAHADRTLKLAFAAGPIPPEMQNLWNRIENAGVEVRQFNRCGFARGEQQASNGWLQLRMLENALRFFDSPGIVAYLTGNGAGFGEGQAFPAAFDLLRERGWGIEVLSWKHSCKRKMREWAEANGAFVSLDDHYAAITYREPSRHGHPIAPARREIPLDLACRPMVRNRSEGCACSR